MAAYRAAILIGCIVLALALPRVAARADDANTLTVQLEWLPDGHHAPIFLAAEKGWFKRAGLDVTLLDGKGSTTTVQLVGTGQFEVGQADLSAMAVAHSKGVPVISIGGIFRKGDIGLIVPEDSPIRGTKDLGGKTIAYSAGSFEAPFMDTFLATGGLTREEVQLLNIDASTKTANYVIGKSDGMMGSGPTQLPLVATRRPSRAISFADVGLELPGYGIFTTPTMLQKKGDALRRFVSIVAAAWTYAASGHQAEAVEATVNQRPAAKLDPAIVAAQLARDIPFLTTPATVSLPMGFQSEADWARAIALLEKTKLIQPGSAPKDYFTNDYLDRDLIKSMSGS